MSVTTETNRTSELTTDGVETDFDFSMLIHDDDELEVWYKPDAGEYGILVLDTHYTVVFTEDGGTVTTIGGSSPYAAGKLLIVRHLDLTQQTNWLSNDNHTGPQHQDDFDRTAMRDIQLQEFLDRCPKFPTHSDTTEITFPEPEANKIIGWNAGGSDLTNISATTLAVLIVDIILGGGIPVELTNLSDVTITSPIAGDLLWYDGDMWTNTDSPTIKDLTADSLACGEIKLSTNDYIGWWHGGARKSYVQGLDDSKDLKLYAVSLLDLQAAGSIRIRPDGDTDDYLQLNTTGGVPILTAVGGDIIKVDDTLQITGNIGGDGQDFGGIAAGEWGDAWNLTGRYLHLDGGAGNAGIGIEGANASIVFGERDAAEDEHFFSCGLGGGVFFMRSYTDGVDVKNLVMSVDITDGKTTLGPGTNQLVLDAAGDVAMSGDLAVTGSGSTGGTFAASGNLSTGANLAVTGTCTITGEFTSTGQIQADSTITILGEDAGDNDYGVNNLFIGYQAGYLNDSSGAAGEGDDNVYIGAYAGYGGSGANNVGQYNIAIGRNALYDNSTGNYNVALGGGALANNTTANDNIAIGTAALADTTISGRNTAIGTNALRVSDGGVDNVAIGNQAMYSLTGASNGDCNVAIGNDAMYGSLTGKESVAIGHQSLYTATVPIATVAIGCKALYTGATTTSDYNVAIGHSAMFKAQSAEFSVCLGASASYNNVTGDNNVVIGCLAGQGATGESNSDNVFIGRSSGNKITTGSDNVFVGYESGLSVTTGGANVFIGHEAGYRQTTLSNLLIIDNKLRADAATEITNAIIYGVMAAAPADQSLRVNAVLNVTENIQIDGTRVVANQQAHIADATTQDLAGTDTVDETKLESDLTGIIGTINSILTALETHGLLAAA